MTDLIYYGRLDIDCEDRTAVWRCCCYVLEIHIFLCIGDVYRTLKFMGLD
jgi:hypothetical protein